MAAAFVAARIANERRASVVAQQPSRAEIEGDMKLLDFDLPSPKDDTPDCRSTVASRVRSKSVFGESGFLIGDVIDHPVRGEGVVVAIDLASKRGKPLVVKYQSGQTHSCMRTSRPLQPQSHRTAALLLQRS